MAGHKKKAFKVLSAMAFVSLFLVGCSKSTTPQVGSSQSSSSSSSVQVDDVTLKYTTFTQAQGVISIPIVLTNNSSSTLDLSSENLTLTVFGHKLKPFQISGEASDFHSTLNAGSSYKNIISFYLGTTLTKEDLKHISLTYKMNNGKTTTATKLTAEDNVNATQANYTELSDYYSNTIAYNEDLAKSENDGTSSTNIEEKFNDADYDKLYFWVIGSKYNSKQIYLKIVNKTSTDFYLDFSTIELVNSNGNEIHIDPNYQSNVLLIPHGKSVNVIVPLESAISNSEVPYTVEFRTDTNSSFFNTKKAFNPVEFVFSNSKLLKDVFTVSPVNYPENGISWKKPSFSKNTLSVGVSLNDYFVIHAEASKFKLVGLNKDGSVGDSETPESMSPSDITSSGTIKLNFDNLEAIKTYKKFALKYEDKTFFTFNK